MCYILYIIYYILYIIYYIYYILYIIYYILYIIYYVLYIIYYILYIIYGRDWFYGLAYLGLWPTCTLCIVRNSLNVIRCLIGSQWSSRSEAVMCSRGSRLHTNRAAAFWTRWSGAIVHCGRPAKTEFTIVQATGDKRRYQSFGNIQAQYLANLL